MAARHTHVDVCHRHPLQHETHRSRHAVVAAAGAQGRNDGRVPASNGNRRSVGGCDSRPVTDEDHNDTADASDTNALDA